MPAVHKITMEMNLSKKKSPWIIIHCAVLNKYVE